VTIADTVWLATALLEKENPRTPGFSYETILKRVFDLNKSLKPTSVHAHLNTHCIASKKANPATLRMLTENADGTLRLFRSGDPCHATRRAGRTQPKPHALPAEYHSLLRPQSNEPPPLCYSEDEDPLLALSGVGKEMWESLGGGEAFIRAIRADEPFTLRPHPPLPASSRLIKAFEKLANGGSRQNDSGVWKDLPTRAQSFEDLWNRIEARAGEEFRTIRGKPFSYNIRGSAIVPRPGQGGETNRLLPRNDFRKAWDRKPLSGPGQIHDLQGPTYIYAILTDPRICGR
jgi:hypothetical protein